MARQKPQNVTKDEDSQGDFQDVLEKYIPTPGGKDKNPRKCTVGAKKESERF